MSECLFSYDQKLQKSENSNCENESKLYSFGVLSDIHFQSGIENEHFKNALVYLSKEDIDFTCICGDLSLYGTDEELSAYKTYVDKFSNGMPIYAVFGNHDTYLGLYEKTEQYTGLPLNYTFTVGDDVFIMVGVVSGYTGNIGTSITKETFQWLYEQLERNRNKRCILFQHFLSANSSGDAFKGYTNSKLCGEEGIVFESLVSHYKNVIWFHGHSHMSFSSQHSLNTASVSKELGCWDVHIPSLDATRIYNDTVGTEDMVCGYINLLEESEGYVVDVYENRIHLRGRDFVREKFLPIANYWLDTSLQIIPQNTYTDQTGTIKI